MQPSIDEVSVAKASDSIVALEQDMDGFYIINHPDTASRKSHDSKDTEMPENLQARIERVRNDLDELQAFYTISNSNRRVERLQKFYQEELSSLIKVEFKPLDQQGKIDYLLLQNYLKRNLGQLELDVGKNAAMQPVLGFAASIIRLCEDRQDMKPMHAEKTAQVLHDVGKDIASLQNSIKGGKVRVDRTSAFRAGKVVDELGRHLEEWFDFYNRYDPMFSWWVAEPYSDTKTKLEEVASLIRERLVAIAPGDADAVVGDPIGREGLLADLAAEYIPYTPEEVIEIGEKEYLWCEEEMIKASRELGYGSDWHEALEHVKTLYVPPGQQTQLVRDLMDEAVAYVTSRDLVTVPPLAAETTRMYMMTPSAQKVNPFFLGGPYIMVSYPTSSMSHADKMMSMRGNNIHFSRSTVFHELIPGHRLQMWMNARHRAYRSMFETCFSVEGWAFYWEMILWDDEEFPKTAENRIGMLFWRMHRCLRIVFSLKFHLGLMTPQECIELLVERGGHERATAEGEVRRSFAGDYSPLYQAGYMLGALQLYALRREVVGGGGVSEKEFHDRIMREGQMPIEMLRALMKGEELEPGHESSWTFYEGL